MLKKLFAAALCGIVIASIAHQADAAGPAALARGYASLEHGVVAQASATAAQSAKAFSALDDYLQQFDQSRQAD